jgi:hypothetical protein
MFEELKDYIATFECNLDDRGNVWGLVINLELED